MVGLCLAVAFASVLAGACGSPSAKVGEPAPPLSGQTLDGQSFDLASLRGRPVIVNFWASWCGPCVRELPLLKQTEAAHRDAGLAIVGVLYKDTADLARPFAVDHGVDWPTLLDPDQSKAQAYRIAAPPQSYFIDRAGVLRSMQIGEVIQVDLDRQLPAILQ